MTVFVWKLVQDVVSLLRYFVHPQYYSRFLELVHHFYLDLGHISCKNILGATHKYIMARPELLRKLGIPVDIVCTSSKNLYD